MIGEHGELKVDEPTPNREKAEEDVTVRLHVTQ